MPAVGGSRGERSRTETPRSNTAASRDGSHLRPAGLGWAGLDPTRSWTNISGHDHLGTPRRARESQKAWLTLRWGGPGRGPSRVARKAPRGEGAPRRPRRLPALARAGPKLECDQQSSGPPRGPPVEDKRRQTWLGSLGAEAQIVRRSRTACRCFPAGFPALGPRAPVAPLPPSHLFRRT